MTAKRLRYAALAVGAAWACWWVFFATAEAISSGRQLVPAMIFFVVMFGALVLAWKWPLAGATLFFLEGVTSIFMYLPMWWRRFGLGGTLLMFAWMPLPPIAAGILLLISSRRLSAGPPAAPAASH